MKTEYRIINDGYKHFLQYKKTKTNSFLFLWHKLVYYWEYVPTDYYDTIYGRSLGSDTNRLSSYNVGDLKKWASEHIDISQYIIDTEKAIKNKKEEADHYWDEKKEKKKQVVYL